MILTVLKLLWNSNLIESFSGCIKTIDTTGYTNYADMQTKIDIKNAILTDFVGDIDGVSYLNDPNSVNNNIKEEDCNLGYMR
tara:strand:- start:181 stop:426 length:246 start_codon:yes stop_codon:yes gene_type:complete